MRTAPWVTCGIFGAVTSFGAAARAQLDMPGNHRDRVEVEAHGALLGSYYCYGAGWGVGARVAIPLGHNGFIPSINNSVAIGVGADVFRNTDVRCRSTALHVPAVLQWNFYLSPTWDVFAEPGVWVGFPLDAGYCAEDTCSAFHVMPTIAVGARWHFLSGGSYPTFLVRAGWPVGIDLGLAI